MLAISNRLQVLVTVKINKTVSIFNTRVKLRYLQFKLFHWISFSLSDIRCSALLVVVSLNIQVLLIKICDFFNIWCIHIFQSFQRFQAIEFVDRPVPTSLDMFKCGPTTNGVCVYMWDERIRHYSFRRFLHKTRQHSVQIVLFARNYSEAAFPGLSWFSSPVSGVFARAPRTFLAEPTHLATKCDEELPAFLDH